MSKALLHASRNTWAHPSGASCTQAHDGNAPKTGCAPQSGRAEVSASGQTRQWVSRMEQALPDLEASLSRPSGTVRPEGRGC